MKTIIRPTALTLWLSASDTYGWANRPGNRWPCSELSGRRLVASFDRNGLCDLAIDGGRGSQDVSGSELSAICADHLARVVPVDHACEFIAVRQHLGDKARMRREACEKALRAAGLHASQR